MAYDFPNAPTLGQVANGYTWDGEKWVTNFSTANPGGVIAIKVFTASGTYTPSPNMSSCVIECVGGGGGGGLAVGTPGNYTSGSGGGSGAYARKFATAADIGPSQPVTVGAGGAGGAGGVYEGSNGSTSSVGALCAAGGGQGGSYAQGGGNIAYGGVGGNGISGDLLIPGNWGGGGTANPAGGFMLSGFGAGSYFGGAVGTGVGYAVSAGNNTGAGGSGGTDYQGGGGGNIAGGAGGSGLVVITEYGLTALTGNSVTTAVRYDVAQTLTTPQQTQARTNINAPSFTDINAAVNPIPKNYVLNGAMMVSQENGAAVGGGSSYYPVDQFSTNISGTTGVISAQQIVSVTPGNSPNRIRITCTTADAAVAAGDYVTLYTPIEGLRIADLRYGAAGALQTTLRFGVKAPAGTYGVSIVNSVGNRSYVAVFTITAGQTNTDTVQSITIPGDVTGTWLKDNGVGMYVQWCLMGGTTYQTTANAWKAGNFTTTSAQFNLMGATARVFELFDVGFYIGATAPPFIVPDYTTELAACQRYWVRGLTTSWIGWVSAGQPYATAMVYFPATMRAAPTMTVTATAGPTNLGPAQADAPSTASVMLYHGTLVAGSASFYDAWTANARL